MEDVAARQARAREVGGSVCAILAVLPALAAPAFRLAWVAVAVALGITVVTIVLLFTGQAQRARTTAAFTYLALVAAQIAHSPMILADMQGLLYRGVLLVALPLPLLIGTFVLATGAADARRRAWGRQYQQKIGYDPERPEPTMDWG